MSTTPTTVELEWSDGLGPRARSPFLIFVRGGSDEVVAFAGSDIPGVVVVRGTDYAKSGKWSHTTYRLRLAVGVRHIAGREGWETGTFAEGIGSAAGRETPDTWGEMAARLGVSVPAAMEFLRAWKPKAAEKLDEVELALAKLEVSEQETDTVIVTVSFGAPTNRAIREGYWESPKSITGYDAAEIRLLDPSKGWVEGNITVVGISGTVLSVRHSSGNHGGYYAVSVAVIPR